MQTMKWFPIKKLKVADDAWPLAICGTVTCPCANGARMVVTGGQSGGRLVYDCEHELDVTHFMILPMPPPH